MKKSTDWLEYDWPFQGKAALYEADMSLDGPSRPEMGVCVEVSCLTRDVKRAELNAREKRHANQLLERAAKLDAVFCGVVSTDAMIMGVYYVSLASHIEPIKELCDRERVVIASVAYKEDGDYSTYYKLLFPDAAKLWTIENGKRIEFYEKHGDALSPARKLTYNMFFPTEQLMLLFSEQARLSGFALGNRIYQPEQELVYGVQLHRIGTLNKLEMDESTTRLVRIAQKCQGELVYWESPVTRSGSPLMRR